MLLVQSYRCQCGHEWSITDSQLVVSTCARCENYPVYAFHETPSLEDLSAGDVCERPERFELEDHDHGEPL